MTIQDAKEAKAKLADNIARLIEEFEDATLTTVHGMTVYESRKGQPNRVELRVGLIETDVAEG